MRHPAELQIQGTKGRVGAGEQNLDLQGPQHEPSVETVRWRLVLRLQEINVLRYQEAPFIVADVVETLPLPSERRRTRFLTRLTLFNA